jgi:hypothetical protein
MANTRSLKPTSGIDAPGAKQILARIGSLLGTDTGAAGINRRATVLSCAGSEHPARITTSDDTLPIALLFIGSAG